MSPHDRERPALSRRDVLRVASEADLDPRTVARIVNGGGVPSSRAVAKALRDALTLAGFEQLAERL
jgi:hypothetical protein